MKKIIALLSFVLLSASFLLSIPAAKADTQVVTDKEFVPGYNYYGRDNSVFLSACTRFTPGKASYTNYFDLAVKNDQGASYPITASIRTAYSAEIPNTAKVKTYHQTSFNNYAMGQGFSRFTSDDGGAVTLTVGNYYYICIDDLANNNATGWFYTNPVSGGHSVLGYPGDVQTPFDGTLGYRTFATETTTPTGGTGDTTGTGTGTNTGTVTTGNSPVAQGGAPSSNISSAIVKPADLTAANASDKLGVVLRWTASTTTTIGGYNIYRSLSTGKDFAKIGDTAKDALTFTDSTVTAGTTYYYMVRAYKGTAESASSNEASIVPTAPSKATGSDVLRDTSVATYNAFEMTPLLWGLIGGAVLLLGILILLILRRRKSAKSKVQAPASPQA